MKTQRILPTILFLAVTLSGLSAQEDKPVNSPEPTEFVFTDEEQAIVDAAIEYEYTRSDRSLEIIREVLAPDSTESMAYVIVSGLPCNHDTLAILKAFAMRGNEVEDSDSIYRARFSAVTELRFFPQKMWMSDEEFAELIAFFEHIRAKGEEDPEGFTVRANHARSAIEYLNSRKAKKLRIKKKPRPKPKPKPPAAVAQPVTVSSDPSPTAVDRPTGTTPDNPSADPPASEAEPTTRNHWLWLGLFILLIAILLRLTRR